MQHTRNTTMTKTDRDTLRSLHGRKKWEHIWAYYKLPIAIVLIVVYILGYTAYRHVTKKEDVLYLGLVNITAGSDLTEQLTTGFAEAQGLTKKQQVDLLSGLLLSESEMMCSSGSRHSRPIITSSAITTVSNTVFSSDL